MTTLIHKTNEDIMQDLQWFADNFGITITEFSTDFSAHRPPFVDYHDIHGNTASASLGTWLTHHYQYSPDFVFSNQWTDLSPEWLNNDTTDILQNLETKFICQYTTQPAEKRDIREAFAASLLDTLEYIHHNIDIID